MIESDDVDEIEEKEVECGAELVVIVELSVVDPVNAAAAVVLSDRLAANRSFDGQFPF